MKEKNPFLTTARVSHLVAHFKVNFKEEISNNKAEAMLTALWEKFVVLMCTAHATLEWEEKDVVAYLSIMRMHLERDLFFLYLEAYANAVKSSSGLTFYTSGQGGDEDADYEKIVGGFNTFDVNDGWEEGVQYVEIGTSKKRKKSKKAYNLNNNDMFFFTRKTKHRERT